MSRTGLTQQDLEKIHGLARRWGKIVIAEAFGPDGPGLDVDLTMMEDVWLAAAAGLVEGAGEAALSEQADLFEEPQACPDCGETCEVRREKPRQLAVGGGQAEWSEPRCHCPQCRRDFFPSASCFED